VLFNDCFTLISENCTTWESIVVNIGKDYRSYFEISDRYHLTTKPLALTLIKLRIETRNQSLQQGRVFVLTYLTKVFLKQLNRVKLADEIVDKINGSINKPGFFSILKWIITV